MLVEQDSSYISTYIRYSDLGNQLSECVLKIAFSKETIKDPFAWLTILRNEYGDLHNTSDNPRVDLNPTVVGEMAQNQGIEFWIKATPEGFSDLMIHRAGSILPRSRVGNRDGDYIDGVHYDKGMSRLERFKQHLWEEPKLFLRMNRHYRKRQRRLHEQQKEFYEEWLSEGVR